MIHFFTAISFVFANSLFSDTLFHYAVVGMSYEFTYAFVDLNGNLLCSWSSCSVFTLSRLWEHAIVWETIESTCIQIQPSQQTRKNVVWVLFMAPVYHVLMTVMPLVRHFSIFPLVLFLPDVVYFNLLPHAWSWWYSHWAWASQIEHLLQVIGSPFFVAACVMETIVSLEAVVRWEKNINRGFVI